MKQQLIGVVGLGSIGMRHAKNLIDLGQKVIGCDADKKKGEELIEYGGEYSFSPDKLKDCRAIVVCVPSEAHSTMFDYFEKKPIFMEKPIATEMEDSLKNVTMVGYNLRFHPCVIQAQVWMQQDFVGKPLWANLVCAQRNLRPDYLREGVILNWSHEIDLALYLLGPGTCVSCVANSNESLADLTIIHNNKCQSTIHLDYLTEPFIRQTIIVFEHVTIIMDLEARQCWIRDKGGNIIDHFEAGDSWDDDYSNEMETFLARLEGETTVGCTGEEGLDTLRVCLEAKALAEKNWKVVTQ